ncbi:MAG: DUF2341 domain-containing protein, partial [Dehalococcoidales bacterium]|nr:DUF2341 domain-containing protein [Dehalococcoidales bacterium]
MLLYPGEGEYLYLFRCQGTYDLSKYYLFKEGIYTSEVKTIGNNKSYGTVNWTSNNKGLIELYARTADNISLTDATSWKDVPARSKLDSLSSLAPAVTAGEEYLQYQLKLYANDTENLPSLSDITVQFKKYPQVQTIVSSPYNSTFSQNRLMGLKWSQTLPAGTGVRFQLRTSADSGGSPASWSSWLGPEGTQTFNYDFSDSGNYAYASTIEVTGGLARLKKMFQDFIYAQRIAIDNSEGATNYTDVSVPIEITAANDHFWENIKNDGSDMRFVDWEGNILKYYKGPNAGFSFDYSSKYTKVMVQIPSVPAGQKIYIYLKYGNSEALDAASALSEFSSAGASFESADFSAYNQQSSNGGYMGVVFDGRYIYYVPYYNAFNGYNGIVMRYDTRYSADTDSAWSRFDAGNINSLYTRGYSGAVFDGRYIYFSPYYNSNVSNYYHGNVLRYDTQGDFDSTGSWAAYDASATGGLVTKGYQGAAFDGRYVYFVPFYNNNVSNYYHGNVLRYDTQGDFNLGDSWASYDASATGALVTKGYQGAVFDGRYLYFVPHSNNNARSHGYVLRFDTQGNFNSSDSWASYNAGSVDFLTTTGYKGASFDGRYIYFAPSNTNWNAAASGNILRYDTEGAFNETNSWSAYNAGGIGNLHTKGYSDAVYDGRYVYFSPYYTSRISGNYHGNVLRLDTQGDFKTADSWVSLDASETDGLSTKGFTGVVSDGNNLYFSPYPAANFLIFNRANLKEIPYYFATLEDQATCVSLSGWQYRSDVDIDNLSGPDMSDYQIKVTLTKDLTESFWARCMENGYDVRFVDSDNTTILPYYRASFNYATKTAEFWIKIPSISASSTKRLYLYYGKADAADVSSFDAVFIKDFNEIGYNTSAVSLDGVDSKLSIGDNNALDISGNLTLEANVKYTVDYWPQGWSYCKTVTLDNSAGTAKTDFVVAFEVPKDAAMNVDYSDLRFWETDKSRRLRYNIASSDENSATVWVLIPSLPAGSTKDILMYYGNASAASEADEDIAGVTTNGLAAWWKFDESSGTSAVDSSGNGYTGTLVNNPAWVEGKYGNALSFNGTNSYVSTSYGLNTNPVTTPRTYAAWVKSNSISTSKMYLSQSDGTARAYFGHSGGYWSMGVHGSGWGETTGGAVNTNWHHVAIVFDGSAAKFYLDGNYVYQKTYTSFTFDQNLLIGAY